MAEIKRTFEGAKQNRDIDDRLLPSGQYRYARNINIGESEGGDIGALENLKGNELIAGQDAIQGTTIGSVRDPNNDRVYWFTTSDTEDAIYEYDESTAEVTTILKEPKARTAALPTCTPELLSRITEPRGDQPNRPTVPALPTPPVGGCRLPGFVETNSPAGDFVDNSLCVTPIATPTVFSVVISGDGTFPVASAPVTLTATVTEALGNVTFLWNTGETTASITVGTAGMAETITGSVTATDDGRTTGDSVTDNYEVIFTTAPIATYTISNVASPSDNVDVTPTQVITGLTPLDISTTVGIAASSGFQFVDATGITATQSGSDLALTRSGQSATLVGTITADGDTTVTWSGTATEPAPVAASFSIDHWGNDDANNNIYTTNGPLIPGNPQGWRTQPNINASISFTPNYLGAGESVNTTVLISPSGGTPFSAVHSGGDNAIGTAGITIHSGTVFPGFTIGDTIGVSVTSAVIVGGARDGQAVTVTGQPNATLSIFPAAVAATNFLTSSGTITFDGNGFQTANTTTYSFGVVGGGFVTGGSIGFVNSYAPQVPFAISFGASGTISATVEQAMGLGQPAYTGPGPRSVTATLNLLDSGFTPLGITSTITITQNPV